MSLGGTLIIRDAIKYDYCVLESVRSLAPICDQFFVLDCGSTDGTLDLIRTLEQEFPNLKIHEGGNWNCQPDYNRLSELTNNAASLLTTTWHFNIQADEVLHESSWPVIKNVIKGPPRAILVRRLNLFGDVDHMLRETRDVIQPCGTGVFRLAPKGYLSYGDGENLEWRTGVADRDNYGNYTLFHYGYVRRDKEHIRKTIDVQSWFYGPGSTVDSRVLTMDPEGRYEWEKLKPKEWLGPLPMPHPKAAMTWVNRRRTESNL